jgi:hypothetical protein
MPRHKRRQHTARLGMKYRLTQAQGLPAAQPQTSRPAHHELTIMPTYVWASPAKQATSNGIAGEGVSAMRSHPRTRAQQSRRHSHALQGSQTATNRERERETGPLTETAPVPSQQRQRLCQATNACHKEKRRHRLSQAIDSCHKEKKKKRRVLTTTAHRRGIGCAGLGCTPRHDCMECQNQQPEAQDSSQVSDRGPHASKQEERHGNGLQHISTAHPQAGTTLTVMLYEAV